MSTSDTDKNGNEGNKELSGYFLVEISLVIDLVKKYYLQVKYTYIKLLHSQYNPFQTYVLFHCMKLKILYTTVPLKTVHMKND